MTEQLSRAPRIEFSKLEPEAFEALIANLLKELGFIVEMSPATRDGGYDILARRPSVNPFEKAIEETRGCLIGLTLKPRFSVISRRFIDPAM